jgi:hypothetical protein
MAPEDYIIKLSDAQTWAKIWRKEEGDYNAHHELHAFLIPKDDLLGILGEGVDAVRAYLGVDENNVEKLMFVGAKYDQITETYIDMLPGRTLSGGNVYDFTRPCPPACDKKSPLNNP